MPEDFAREDAADGPEDGSEDGLDLIESFLAGRASEEDVARVSDDLAKDPALLDRYIELAAVEVLLNEQRSGARTVRKRRPRTLRTRRTLTVLPWLAAVAAGLVFAVLFWPSGRKAPQPTVRAPTETRERVAPAPEPAERAPAERPPAEEAPAVAAAPAEPHRPYARFRKLIGAVMYSRAGSGKWLPASPEVELAKGDVTRTGSSRAAIALESGSTIYVNHSTMVSVGNGGGVPGMALSEGEAYVEVAPGASPREIGFRSETPHGSVTALGTRFGVAAGPEGTAVLVAEGEVEAITEVGRSRAGAGYEITLAGVSAAPSAPMPAFDIRERLAWTAELGARDIPQVELAIERVADALVVLYLFEEGEGETVHDSSGFGDALELGIPDGAAVRWEAGYLTVHSPVLIASPGPATKVTGACMASNEITIEAWIRPAVAAQGGPARVVTLSSDAFHRNFTLAQGKPLGEPSGDFDVRLRTTHTDLNGQHPMSTSARPKGATEGVMHVVYTRDASGWVRLFIDGEVRAFARIGGDFSNWDGGYRLALADELNGKRAWLGEYHLLAIHRRALAPREVEINYRAGY